MSKLRCVVIDDEPIATDYICNYVNQMPQLKLVASFNSAQEAYELIQRGEVDVLFLDIQMPGLTGLDFIRTLDRKPHIILITAYSEYALDGFNLNVTDYLLKPVRFERFAQAVLKLSSLSEISFKSPTEDNMRKKDYIFLKSGYKSVKVMIDEITHVEGSKEYVTFYSEDGKKYIKNERLKNVEEQFSSFDFLRIHKSFLVNLKYVHSFYGNTIEIFDMKIPIGRAYKEDLKKWVE
ncbi:LytTR family DNA-binding domain-containing protein [Halosquirtibacter laminarini]|uniref:LytTR family DNA-binding domain-containing protein n=1 Tax=Halosquirtibacter laminarini TaxID=3374600 RepID=A0AC61NLC3_9BACT|nr:LytTR family DNA-binding domain-containing protein [Prolixibacteraceae bacterium]